MVASTVKRCPHRGVALSLGTVSQGLIACAYHGWRLDGTGRCRHIPSLRPEQPVKTAPARTYPTTDRDGYV
ncbi:MAG: Rieske 2Fe-2S domain-containing protein [Gluconacetobacter sp.]|uniref:Rieske 2Fe-2S domain-containing protein n=1 Tax=Gluconacetobacter dulcium TaxID=2729096 RepID=A0A7W4JWL4_9PROT|nr:Rieske 2Fe-2S domain-containing protein [Gluconacetobacter dulcium]MBB2195947.1 Rieske 2Fe-2S domain-containing protein [Gluconacetobacter dulcium]